MQFLVQNSETFSFDIFASSFQHKKKLWTTKLKELNAWWHAA